jgi:hypothetical protein
MAVNGTRCGILFLACSAGIVHQPPSRSTSCQRSAITSPPRCAVTRRNLERRLIQGQVPAGRGVCVLRGRFFDPLRHAIHQRSEHACVTAPRSVAPCAEQGSRRSFRRRSRSSASYAPARGRDWRAQARHVPRSHRGGRVRPCDESTRQAILPTAKFLPNHARVAAPASLVTLRVLLHIQVGQCAQRLNLGALTVCGRVTAD